MTLVVDASAMVAALLDNGSLGRWAESRVAAEPLAAPEHMLVEAASTLRRTVLAGYTTADVAALAYHDLTRFRVRLFPFRPFADRVWELRHNLTCGDAWYVAVAEVLDAPLLTLDQRLARAHGPVCRFHLPPWAEE